MPTRVCWWSRIKTKELRIKRTEQKKLFDICFKLNWRIFYIRKGDVIEPLTVLKIDLIITKYLSDCMPYMVIAWYERMDFRVLSRKQVVLAITSEKYTQNTAS
jgi:hypothetical protein